MKMDYDKWKMGENEPETHLKACAKCNTDFELMEYNQYSDVYQGEICPDCTIDIKDCEECGTTGFEVETRFCEDLHADLCYKCSIKIGERIKLLFGEL